MPEVQKHKILLTDAEQEIINRRVRLVNLAQQRLEDMMAAQSDVISMVLARAGIEGAAGKCELENGVLIVPVVSEEEE